MGVEIIAVPPDASGQAWDDFLDAHPHGSFYHRYGWRRLNQAQLGHTCLYLEARVGGSVTGVLPLVLTNSRIFGRILCSLPFVNYGGPIAVDAETTRMLVKAAREHAARFRVDYLELRCNAPLDTDLPVSVQKVSMTLELQLDPDRLWNGFASKHRTNIRRVYKDGLVVTGGGRELLPEFYSVMQRSWRDLGTPLYAPAYFEAIVEAFPERTRIFVCRRNDEPVAVAFNGNLAGTVEGMWAGTTPLGHELNANYVLYWEMIKEACEQGYHRFHLGRSTAGSGAEQFKKKWNAATTQLYWYHYRPDGRPSAVVNVDNPKFRLAIAAWRKLPLWATRVLGPPLARVIP
ncbi:MAG: FemAB family PEP-CTERM system-associated protein [Steroidobacteraceae bacterium]|nr:FemAB family PEP-CTERM system-associated protein [Steroidobacteraceae bacterium]